MSKDNTTVTEEQLAQLEELKTREIDTSDIPEAKAANSETVEMKSGSHFFRKPNSKADSRESEIYIKFDIYL